MAIYMAGRRRSKIESDGAQSGQPADRGNRAGSRRPLREGRQRPAPLCQGTGGQSGDGPRCAARGVFPLLPVPFGGATDPITEGLAVSRDAQLYTGSEEGGLAERSRDGVAAQRGWAGRANGNRWAGLRAAARTAANRPLAAGDGMRAATDGRLALRGNRRRDRKSTPAE